MKKLLLVLAMLLLLGCSKVVRYDYPAPIMGTLPNGLTIAQAENIITSGCVARGWRITDRTEGWMKIELFKKDYDFYASITYNENNYTISMDEVTSPDRVKDFARRSKLFSGYASKLARTIQKEGLKAQKLDTRTQSSSNIPQQIIINNNNYAH